MKNFAEPIEDIVNDTLEEPDINVIDNIPIPEPHKVYVKANENNCIIAINSSMFLNNEIIVNDGWIQIDAGYEYPKYPHAQGNYFEGGIYTVDGFARFKLEESEELSYPYVVERTEEEVQTDRDSIVTPPLEASVWDDIAIAIQEGVDEV